MTKILIDGQIQTITSPAVVSHHPHIITQNADYIRPEEVSEAGQVIKSLFSNDYDDRFKTHSIDQKANLDSYQVRGLTALDVLDRVNFLPHIANSVSMQTKFLSVSKNARGRDDHVNIVQAKKEQDVNMAGGGFVKNLIGMGAKK